MTSGIWSTRWKSRMPISMAMLTTLSSMDTVGRKKLPQPQPNWNANRLRLNMDKTKLLWAGTRYHVSTLNDSSPSLQLNNVIYGRRAFAVAGPMTFNPLPNVRDPSVSTPTFGQLLKNTHFLCLSARLTH